MEKITPKFVLIGINYVIEDTDFFIRKANDIISRTLLKIFSYENESLHNFIKLNSGLIQLGTIPLSHHYDYWRRLLSRILNIMEKDVDLETIDKVFRYYTDLYANNSSLYPETKDFLLTLKKRGTKIAILSNGNPIRVNSFITKHKICKLVDAVSISGETPSKKPEPYMFETALTALGANPWESLMIGDRTDTDIRGANEYGIWSALLKRSRFIRYKNPLLHEDPDFEISSLSSALNIRIPFKEKSVPNSVALLAGGKGSRLGLLSKIKQKCLIDLGSGDNLLEWHLRVWETIGIKRIILILKEFANDVIEYLEKRKNNKSKISYVVTSEEGTALALSKEKKFLSDPFIFGHIDLLYEKRLIYSLIKNSLKNPDKLILTVCDGTIAPTHAGLLLGNFTKDKIRGFVFPEKKGELKTSLPVSFGLGILPKEIIDFLENRHSSDMVENGIESWLKAGRGDVLPLFYRGDYCHLVYKNDIEIAKAFLKKYPII